MVAQARQRAGPPHPCNQRRPNRVDPRDHRRHGPANRRGSVDSLSLLRTGSAAQWNPGFRRHLPHQRPTGAGACRNDDQHRGNPLQLGPADRAGHRRQRCLFRKRRADVNGGCARRPLQRHKQRGAKQPCRSTRGRPLARNPHPERQRRVHLHPHRRLQRDGQLYLPGNRWRRQLGHRHRQPHRHGSREPASHSQNHQPRRWNHLCPSGHHHPERNRQRQRRHGEQSGVLQRRIPDRDPHGKPLHRHLHRRSAGELHRHGQGL